MTASASPKPRVVMAGLPRRMPEVTNGFSGSFGMASAAGGAITSSFVVRFPVRLMALPSFAARAATHGSNLPGMIGRAGTLQV